MIAEICCKAMCFAYDTDGITATIADGEITVASNAITRSAAFVATQLVLVARIAVCVTQLRLVQRSADSCITGSSALAYETATVILEPGLFNYCLV